MIFVSNHFMTTLPTLKQLDKARQKSPWEFGNKILYDLCRDNFLHEQDDKILTKVLFIGRIYAAAVERRKNKENDLNDNFYIDTVAPTFRKSQLDKYLIELKKLSNLTVANIQVVLQTHYYLTLTLRDITKLEKRSFSSKYLHFHLPELFFIYDSRSLSALRCFISRVPYDLIHILHAENIDKEYATFFCKCFELKRQIENHYNTTLSNRQFDNLLIEVANNKNGAK